MKIKSVFFSLAFLFFSSNCFAGTLTLQWKDNSINEDGFKIERRLGTAGAFAEIGQTLADVTTFNDTTPDDQIYCYQVHSFNLAGDSGPSNIACGPKPKDPDALTVTTTTTTTTTTKTVTTP